MFDYVILAALGYFSYYYISQLITAYNTNGTLERTHWLMLALVVAMIVFFVLYLIRIIKRFKNKEQREKEKAEREAKQREKEREIQKKRIAQYLPDYDEITDYDDIKPPVIDSVDEGGEAPADSGTAADSNTDAVDSEPTDPEQK